MQKEEQILKNTKKMKKGKTLRMWEKVRKRWQGGKTGDKKVETHAKVEKCGKKYKQVDKGIKR